MLSWRATTVAEGALGTAVVFLRLGAMAVSTLVEAMAETDLRSMVERWGGMDHRRVDRLELQDKGISGRVSLRLVGLVARQVTMSIGNKGFRRILVAIMQAQVLLMAVSSSGCITIIVRISFGGILEEDQLSFVVTREGDMQVRMPISWACPRRF